MLVPPPAALRQRTAHTTLREPRWIWLNELARRGAGRQRSRGSGHRDVGGFVAAACGARDAAKGAGAARSGPDITRHQLRSFGLIIAIFIVLLLIALSASWSAIDLVNSTRSYATGEGRYTKAQKLMVINLHRYADSALETDYAAFLAAAAIPRGDRRARLALASTPPDLAAAAEGLLAGDNHPDDIAGLIWLYRWFSWWGPFAAALADWQEGDERVAGLIELGDELHQRIASGTLDAETRARLLDEVDRLDGRLTTLERAFSTHMGEAARTATKVVLAALSATIIVLWAFGTLFASRLLRRQLALDRQLSASEQRFRQLFEIGSDYFFETDSENRLTSVSPNYEAVVGLPAPTELGTRLVDGPGVALDAEMQKMFRLAVAQRKPIRDFVYARKLPSGEVRWISASAMPIFAADGTYLGLRGVGANITARINAETQLHHSDRLEALGMLAGGVAHELNNALVPVIALTDLVARRLPAEGRDRRNLGMVLKGAERSRELVKQILAFSRKEEHHRDDIELASVVRQALSMLRATLPASIRLEEEIEASAPVTGDPTQLHQVIVNIVNNAAHAIGVEMGTIRVRLMREPEGDYLRLSVSDTGCGMDEATRLRIFEPFFTTKPVGEGTGLGLAVVHGIVKAHGGHVEVESAPGRGTSFHILLPLRPAVAGEAA
jgi:PAS domain S-box-containing protein